MDQLNSVKGLLAKNIDELNYNDCHVLFPVMFNFCKNSVSNPNQQPDDKKFNFLQQQHLELQLKYTELETSYERLLEFFSNTAFKQTSDQLKIDRKILDMESLRVRVYGFTNRSIIL